MHTSNKYSKNVVKPQADLIRFSAENREQRSMISVISKWLYRWHLKSRLYFCIRKNLCCDRAFRAFFNSSTNWFVIERCTFGVPVFILCHMDALLEQMFHKTAASCFRFRVISSYQEKAKSSFIKSVEK